VGLTFNKNYSLAGIALGTIVVVLGWHLARVLAPQEMRDALRAEDGYYGGTGPAIGEYGVHEVGGTRGHHEAPDPSSVDELGRPGVPGPTR
jgi:hypothetical protein